MVDDNAENLFALEAILADLGQNLVQAHSGTETLKWLLEHECAVILLDVQMPEMDGFETAALIRQREKTRATPIIFLTAASTNEKHMFRGYSLGAVDYLLKPLVSDVLRAKVAIFIDLYQQRNREVRELREALAAQKAMTGWGESAVTASIAGVGPLRERAAEVFASLHTEYGLLLDNYLEALGCEQPPPRREINALAERLGDQGAGPRDLIDLHIQVVTDKCVDAHPNRARAYTANGRLLALEVMGNLVDYYRTRRPVPV
ncbi:MAG: response regulator [Planctomycetes bacterium]|nr:response regulator [Planctomycetota bacterium]